MARQLSDAEKLRSAEVPQLPRDLGKIAEFVASLSRRKEEFSGYSRNQQRAVDYVCQSAWILGLVTSTKVKEARLTPTGRVFVGMSPTEQRRRLTYAFEASRVGAMWLTWSDNARDLRQLSGAQAIAFLTECATNLSEGEEGTLAMRAGALAEWLSQLKEARNQRELSDIRPTRRPCPLDELQPSVFEPGGSYDLVHALVQGCSKIDIATGFFTLGGFELVADGLDNPDLRILVGGFEEDRRSARHAAFLIRFVESLDQGLEPSREVRRSVIGQIYWRIVHGNIALRSLDARMIERLHAKVFIFGDRAVYVTSANLTRAGLQKNVEGGHLLTREDRADDIAYFSRRFEEHWRDGIPLAEEVLRKIEESWFFQNPVSPYLAFLRALHLLYGRPKEPDRVPARQLAEFQKLLVQHLLGKLTERRGVLFVAPTGTGKTVMSAYIAAALWGTSIRRVLVVCNNDSLKRYWTREIQMMGIDAHIITSGRLRGKSKHPEQSLEDIDHVKKYLHEDTLVIVDECHQYRTPKSNGYAAVRSLLLPDDRRSRPHALLLTATPISRGLDNLHALLTLTDYEEPAEIETYAAAAVEPGLVNVTLPDILRHFGMDDPSQNKRALEFADGLRYYPHIELELVSYDSPMSAIFDHLADFAELMKNYADLEKVLAEKLSATGDLDEEAEFGGNLRKYAGLLKTLLARRAESSPAALVRTIERLVEAIQERSLTEAEQNKLTGALEPVLLAARQVMSSNGADTKLANLLMVLRKHRGKKILIFSEYIDTAEYLLERLKVAFRRTSVVIDVITGNTAKSEKRRLILGFAPEAQEGARAQEIDILIGTDAISEGENLQDARVLVNYDLPWTPLRLVQRLGRIDRPTPYSRKVHAYNYFPAGKQYRQLVTHWTRLESRSAHVRELSDAEVLTSTSRDPSNYRGMPKRLYFEVAKTYRDLLEAVREQQVPTSTFLQVQLTANEGLLREAEALPAGIYTARKGGARAGLYLLVEIEEMFHCLVVFADELLVHTIDRHRFLLALKSDPSAPLAELPPDMDRRVADALRLWSEHLDPGDVERVTLQIALWLS